MVLSIKNLIDNYTDLQAFISGVRKCEKWKDMIVESLMSNERYVEGGSYTYHNQEDVYAATGCPT
jgi:hypothetical protein